ncbi:MAG: hypothetical protein SFU98_01315 [Leptospiraceae bacterium]|nr:hypothetical protein [Leptospiraceae bacterium]
MKVKFLTIKCKDIERSRSFYELLGINFVKEKHEDGPEHYSSNINGMVLELYPTKDNIKNSLIIGLELDLLVEEIIEKIQLRFGNQNITKNKNGNLVIKDPDENTIHLFN